jgi:hypothetical protein
LLAFLVFVGIGTFRIGGLFGVERGQNRTCYAKDLATTDGPANYGQVPLYQQDITFPDLENPNWREKRSKTRRKNNKNGRKHTQKKVRRQKYQPY